MAVSWKYDVLETKSNKLRFSTMLWWQDLAELPSYSNEVRSTTKRIMMTFAN